MPQLIECCAYNIDEQTRQQLQQLRSKYGVTVIEECCQGHCCECFEGPYLLVDGALLCGASHDVMLKEIFSHRSTRKEEEGKRRGREGQTTEPGA
ncbi:MAG: DUF1450 domain-containing protein [Abitibacteriaceae bacterium]|nr:DUF1450 domain-containing protein [Abditibacteriaceae bacterium]